MTQEEKLSALYALKTELEFGSSNVSATYYRLEKAYKALLESGYSREKADNIVDEINVLAKREHKAWKECTNLLDSLFAK